MQMSAARLDLSLRHPFTTAHGTQRVAENVWLRLRYGGWAGMGEGSPRAHYGQTPDAALRALRACAPRLACTPPFRFHLLLDAFASLFPRQRAALMCLDLALHDLAGKMAGRPVWSYFGSSRTIRARTSYTLGLDDVAMVQQKIAEARGYPILKVKMGVPGDLEILREVRRLCPRRTLRVDANGGWSFEEAVEKCRALEALGVELVEQPLAAGDRAALKRLKGQVGLPIVADEDCITAADVPALAGCVDGVNLKLSKCGGLRATHAALRAARDAGLRVMLGCMIESPLAITAAAHLAALADWLDLDGALLLARSPFLGVRIGRDGRLTLPRRFGLGARRHRA